MEVNDKGQGLVPVCTVPGQSIPVFTTTFICNPIFVPTQLKSALHGPHLKLHSRRPASCSLVVTVACNKCVIQKLSSKLFRYSYVCRCTICTHTCLNLDTLIATPALYAFIGVFTHCQALPWFHFKYQETCMRCPYPVSPSIVPTFFYCFSYSLSTSAKTYIKKAPKRFF